MPFHGEKGTTFEGGHRVPLLVKSAGVIKPGTIYNDLVAHNDWMPTFASAAGATGVKEKLAHGAKLHGKDFKMHLDGYDFLPYLKGEAKKAPREEYFYFGQGGELNAVRWNDWKVNFAMIDGNIATRSPAGRLSSICAQTPTNTCRSSPARISAGTPTTSGCLCRSSRKIKAFFRDFEQYPYQAGASLNAAGINYQTLKAMEALKRLEQLESLSPPSN